MPLGYSSNTGVVGPRQLPGGSFLPGEFVGQRPGGIPGEGDYMKRRPYPLPKAPTTPTPQQPKPDLKTTPMTNYPGLENKPITPYAPEQKIVSAFTPGGDISQLKFGEYDPRREGTDFTRYLYKVNPDIFTSQMLTSGQKAQRDFGENRPYLEGERRAATEAYLNPYSGQKRAIEDLLQKTQYGEKGIGEPGAALAGGPYKLDWFAGSTAGEIGGTTKKIEEFEKKVESKPTGTIYGWTDMNTGLKGSPWYRG